VDGTWQCSQLAIKCAGSCPPPEDGQSCEANSIVESGVFECCGSILPNWRCSCDNTTATYECTLLFPPGVVCSCAAPPDPELAVGEPPQTDPPTTECPIIQDPAISEIPVGSCNVLPETPCNYGKTCWYVTPWRNSPDHYRISTIPDTFASPPLYC
jgi:hypothetical protein